MTAAVLLVAASTAAYLWLRPSSDVTVSNAHCVAPDGKRIVTFTAHNSAKTKKTASVEITVYSEVPNGVATDPVVAGVKRVEVRLGGGETRTITEEVQGTREPIRWVLAEKHPVDVRVLKTENGGVQPANAAYRR
ncbi:MAG: hypothetical protein HY343_05920 [Lentisphaerae bacterium]|nr:hypothetical protein [Lentisphaerota bacterium]